MTFCNLFTGDDGVKGKNPLTAVYLYAILNLYYYNYKYARAFIRVSVRSNNVRNIASIQKIHG